MNWGLWYSDYKNIATCRKDGRYRCRFDYSKNASDVGNKARFYVLRHAQGAEMINPYNPSLLRAWGANMDIQMVGMARCMELLSMYVITCLKTNLSN